MKEDTKQQLWCALVEISDDKGVSVLIRPIEDRVRNVALHELGKPPRFNTTDGSIYNVYDREPHNDDVLALAKDALEIYRHRLRQQQARVNRLAKWCQQAESKLKIVKP